jgi:hypothetical protein
MKRSSKPIASRHLEISSPTFRLRAFALALAALVMGIAALVLALTSRSQTKRAEVTPLPSSSAPEWPEGFVEWTALPADSAAPNRTVPSAAAK